MFALQQRPVSGQNSEETLQNHNQVEQQEVGSDRVINLSDRRKLGNLNRSDQATQEVADDGKRLVFSLKNVADASSSLNQNLAQQRYIQSLNTQLHKAVYASDAALCRSLIEMRADVNAKDQNGRTPLQFALNLIGHLPVSKTLIDLGAEVTEADKVKIGEALKTECSSRGINRFLIRRPPPNVPQVMVPSSVSSDPYISLTALVGKTHTMTKPILLIFLADEKLSINYGAVTKSFQRCELLPYGPDAQFFSIMKVFVQNKDRMVDVMDHLREACPGCPILHVVIDAHACDSSMYIGNKSIFSFEDRPLMRQIATRVHPLGTITLAGCNTSNQYQYYCISRVFSEQAYGRIVYGSPIASLNEDWAVFPDLSEGLPPLYVPYFIPSPKPGYKPEDGIVDESRVGHVDIYHKGKKLASATNVHKLAFGDRQAMRPCLNAIVDIQKAQLRMPQSLQSENLDPDSPDVSEGDATSRSCTIS